MMSHHFFQYAPNPMVDNLLDQVNVEDLFDQYYTQ
jgi:hypothetical protein